MPVRNIEPAVERAGPHIKRRDRKLQQLCVSGVCHCRQILAGHLRSRGVPHKENIAKIQEVFFRVPADILHHRVDVVKLRRESVFWREAVGEIDDRKPSLRKTHAVKAVEILVPVDIAAPVHAHNHRKRACRPFRVIDVKNLLGVTSVRQVPDLYDILGFRKSRVPLLVIGLKELLHPCRKDVLRSHVLQVLCQCIL